MQTKPEEAWAKFLEYAVQPTMSPDNLAALKMAFTSAYLYALADLADAVMSDHCLECAWGALIDDAKKAQEKQAAIVNALRLKVIAKAKLN